MKKETSKMCNPLNLLLVEDSNVDAYMLQSVLDKHMECKCNVKHVKDMQHAKYFLEGSHKKVDIILLDLGLPDTNGGESTFCELETVHNSAPIVIVTSRRRHDLALTIVDDGAEDFINKSTITADPQRLCDAIDFAVCRHKHSEEHKIEKCNAVKEKNLLMELVTGGYSVTKK